MRKLVAVSLFALFTLVTTSAFGQGIDFAFGLSTLKSASATTSEINSCFNGGPCNAQQIGGGAFPGFSGDFLVHKNLGVQGEVFWRASRNNYLGSLPFRPIMYDFNAIYAPRFGRVGPELMAGIGALSSRFYQNQIVSCSFSGCTNYTSSNHFALHVGGGLKLYFMKSVFLRPEVHYYYVRNADVEFTSNNVLRIGASIGVSFGR